MQKLTTYFKQVMIGGVYLVFPLVILMYVIRMAHDFVATMISPLSKILPDIIPGYDGSFILATLILLLLCLLGGTLLLNKNNRSRFDSFERNLLMTIPGYSKLKMGAAMMVGDPQNSLQTVLIQEAGSITLGAIVEYGTEWSTVYIPGSPNPDSGSIRFMRTSALSKSDISTKDVMLLMKSRGIGSAAILGKLGRTADPAALADRSSPAQSGPDGSR